MVSARDNCKRALVTLLKTLALLYGCCVEVTRDSTDADVRLAYRTDGCFRDLPDTFENYVSELARLGVGILNVGLALP